MGFMAWSSKFELGIPEMDEQHKKWLAILNSFYDHLSDKDLTAQMKSLIQDVIDYTQYHFSEEEKLMASIGYHELNQQKQMHKEITDKIIRFKQRLDAGNLVISTAVTSELKSWFKEHIMIEDKKYAEKYFQIIQKGGV